MLEITKAVISWAARDDWLYPDRWRYLTRYKREGKCFIFYYGNYTASEVRLRKSCYAFWPHSSRLGGSKNAHKPDVHRLDSDSLQQKVVSENAGRGAGGAGGERGGRGGVMASGKLQPFVRRSEGGHQTVTAREAYAHSTPAVKVLFLTSGMMTEFSYNNKVK
ncbi:hypothetical protein EVAR_92367_1 [Eumeta japonica]|uniref:Uncharacterized protein n=1 Tax=Eumeta variegata TaxID=151549 RepID=A0A4C1TJS8_EUMVA|nr:hypothetical protein EVAR_92367_1 [Eumeta japonica]